MLSPFNPVFVIPVVKRTRRYWKILIESSNETKISARKLWVGPGLHPKTGANWTQAIIDSGKISRTEEQVVFTREGVKSREISVNGIFSGAEAFGYNLPQIPAPQTLQEAYYKCGDTGDVLLLARDLYDAGLTPLEETIDRPRQAIWNYQHCLYGVFSQRDPIPHADGDVFAATFKVREHVSACGGDRTVESPT